MAAQTSYTTALPKAFAGMLSDASDNLVDSRRNAESSELPFGILVAYDATPTDDGMKLPAAAGDSAKLLGALFNSPARDNIGTTTGLKAGALGNVLSRGRCWMQYDGSAPAISDPVYCRFATSADTLRTQKGAVRKDADGVADVWTLTPTAGNSLTYGLRVQAPSGAVFNFDVVSDGTATATEIVTSFKTAMAANAAFTAEVTASGTSTLVLTAVAAGKAMAPSATGDGAFASITNTTPAAPTAFLVNGARFLRAGASGLVEVEIDANVSRLP